MHAVFCVRIATNLPQLLLSISLSHSFSLFSSHLLNFDPTRRAVTLFKLQSHWTTTIQGDKLLHIHNFRSLAGCMHACTHACIYMLYTLNTDDMVTRC